MARRSLCLTAAVAALVLLSVAETRAEPFVTAGGARVELPGIEGLGCREMRAVLDAIDATGYRGAMPEPQYQADLPLLRYEHRLSAAFFAECVRGRVDAAQSREAFGQGYRP